LVKGFLPTISHLNTNLKKMQAFFEKFFNHRW
jgi:hypothetical protein